MSNPEHTPDALPVWATETVHIVPADPAWQEKAQQQRQQLLPLLSPFGVHNIQHIGSTSVPDLPAKPILDLAAEIPAFDSIDDIAGILRPFDWHYVPPELDRRPERRFFIKVRDDKRAVHLHFILTGSKKWQEQLSFRDTLIQNPLLKEQYATLKMELAKQHGNDREAYTEAKSDFIARALAPRFRIIFATNNDHKVAEIQAAIGSSLEVVSLRAAGIDIDIPEPHDTLEANATEKSSTIHRLTGASCFSEDTGLEVAALNGEPGVKSARYAGDGRSFEANIEKLLNKLSAAAKEAASADGGQSLAPAGANGAVQNSQPPTSSNSAPFTHRQARFRTVISLIWEGTEHQFEGICNGHILPAATGKGGFGYDPIFVPEGETRSFAQMSLEEKNQYSHRRKAADQLVAFLQKAAPGTSDSTGIKTGPSL
ncbi:MAG TPA: non-canonical purine NTP pyrophosphatase [Puia sp.]|nr:non-canonical purine NTP pyrophosphatase [Puia sp.]